MTICHKDEFVHISFFGWCSFFLFYGIKKMFYGIKKMATDGGGGLVDGRARWFQVRILVPGWNPNPDANLFLANFCIQIDQYEFIQLYKLYSTNSYYYTNCIVQIHLIIQIVLYELFVYYEFIQQRERRSPSRERAAQAARAKPEHTSCPDQAALGCPTVRVHPAAPTLGYTRLPRPLGYTRLPRR